MYLLLPDRKKSFVRKKKNRHGRIRHCCQPYTHSKYTYTSTSVYEVERHCYTSRVQSYSLSLSLSLVCQPLSIRLVPHVVAMDTVVSAHHGEVQPKFSPSVLLYIELQIISLLDRGPKCSAFETEIDGI